LSRVVFFVLAAAVFVAGFFSFLIYERDQVQAQEPVGLGQTASAGALIRYDFNFVEPVYHHELNNNEIGNLKSDGQSSEDGRVSGLTVADFNLDSSYRLDYDHSWMKSEYSLWLEEITVRFAYKSIAVYVTRDFAEGSCAYQVTLDHEKAHVDIHRRLYLKYQQALRQALEKNPVFSDQDHPVTAASLEAGKAQFDQEISSVLDPVFQQFRQELADEQSQLDTPQNYLTLHNQCSSW
jgi:hypothetical protein